MTEYQTINWNGLMLEISAEPNQTFSRIAGEEYSLSLEVVLKASYLFGGATRDKKKGMQIQFNAMKSYKPVWGTSQRLATLTKGE